MELIDSHCHLDLPAFNDDREAVIARSRAAGVAGFVVPGVQASGWEFLWALSQRVAGLYPAFGLHPVFLAAHAPGDVEQLEQWIAQHRPVAIGEIGLDFHVDGLDAERQQALFEAQLAVARDAQLPVILHVLKAHDQVLSTLKRLRVSGGIVHAFNGSLQQAQQYIDLGFSFGFGGMLTFERSSKLRALASALPLQSILLETDAPDMTVVQHRGERNSPEYLPFCLAALADVRDTHPLEVARITTQNVRERLGLDHWQPPRAVAGS
jgi:TatD DNase family protein